MIQGSHFQASDTVKIETGNLEVLASKDTNTASQKSKSAELSLSYTWHGAAGGPSGNISYSRSKSGDNSTSYNNSSIQGNIVETTSEQNTTIAGANIRGEEQLDVIVGGDLRVEAKQNRASGSNKSLNVSVGLGVNDQGNLANISSASIGGAKGRYTEKQTVNTDLTGTNC